MGEMFSLLMAEFLDLADPTPESLAFMKAERFDEKLVMAFAGNLALIPCTFDDAGFFDFDPNGETCCVFEVLDEDAATTVDLCAFSVASPERFGRAMGTVPVLGATNVTNPASWSFGKMLAIHRNPLDWLRAGCSGVVILDHVNASACLSRKLGDLLAEDEEHARDLRMMLCQPPVDSASIKFPRAIVRRAAA